MIGNEIPEGYDPSSLLARFEWQHIQTSARRHASARDARIVVIGERSEDGTGWHYVIALASSPRARLHVARRAGRLLGQWINRNRALP